jgi:hypothetical protein
MSELNRPRFGEEQRRCCGSPRRQGVRYTAGARPSSGAGNGNAARQGRPARFMTGSTHAHSVPCPRENSDVEREMEGKELEASTKDWPGRKRLGEDKREGDVREEENMVEYQGDERCVPAAGKYRRPKNQAEEERHGG